MTLITFKDGTVVMRDGKVGTEQACCCGGGVCCGIPKNCTVTVSTTSDFVYDQATGLWTDGANFASISFGDCRNLYQGPTTDEFAVCCISYSAAATPGPPCTLGSGWIVARIVCDSCCNAEPEFDGDQNEYGVNCRLEGIQKYWNEVGDCSALKAAVDFDNWDITMTCDAPPDPCNPLP